MGIAIQRDIRRQVSAPVDQFPRHVGKRHFGTRFAFWVFLIREWLVWQVHVGRRGPIVRDMIVAVLCGQPRIKKVKVRLRIPTFIAPVLLRSRCSVDAADPSLMLGSMLAVAAIGDIESCRRCVLVCLGMLS